jgi:type IV pilus assembly protein PilB
MDLSERRLPQKGSLTFRVSNAKTINFRVAALPVLFGEKISLRVADSAVAKVEMDQLGYEPDQLERVLDALHKPRGLVLVTGPTGSGKTVSLYTALTRISRPEVSISTVEDPVEILLEGINQCPVNPAIGLDYENALKAIMSHDPDIVMAAELPDLATANAAFKAAQTGHLVLSSVNTNSAPETLTFLRNLGISSYNLANSINLIIAQRLARRLCKHCRVLLDMPKDALIEEGFSEKDMASVLHIYKPGGCQECEKGYKGRVGIFEVVEITSEIARVIMSGGSALQIAEVCQQEGFHNLYQSGLKKVMDGQTSLDEIHRVTGR